MVMMLGADNNSQNVDNVKQIVINDKLDTFISATPFKMSAT